MKSIFARFDPKDAAPHERHNRARAALLAYQKEANLDVSYISGVSDDSVLKGMLIDIELMLVERHGEQQRHLVDGLGGNYAPEHPESPDAVGLEFITNIAGRDIYRGGHTTSSTFIVVRSTEPGDYATTDSIRRYAPGFFDPSY